MSRTKPEIIQYLKSGIPLFAGFTEELLGKLVNSSRVMSYEPNEAIVHCGAEATHLGVILAGTATASAIADGGTRLELGRLEAGSTFGEQALMTGEKTLAELIAATRCEVLLIPVSVFQSIIVAEPQAVQHISRTISERFKTLVADPAKAAAVLRQGDDPYGFKLKGEQQEHILVINCGSSSLKYTYYDTDDDTRHVRGQVERIGLDGTRHVHRGSKGEVARELPKSGFAEAMAAKGPRLIDALVPTLF